MDLAVVVVVLVVVYTAIKCDDGAFCESDAFIRNRKRNALRDGNRLERLTDSQTNGSPFFGG